MAKAGGDQIDTFEMTGGWIRDGQEDETGYIT
jgi:hypothetical protein